MGPGLGANLDCRTRTRKPFLETARCRHDVQDIIDSTWSATCDQKFLVIRLRKQCHTRGTSRTSSTVNVFRLWRARDAPPPQPVPYIFARAHLLVRLAPWTSEKLDIVSIAHDVLQVYTSIVDTRLEFGIFALAGRCGSNDFRSPTQYPSIQFEIRLLPKLLSNFKSSTHHRWMVNTIRSSSKK